MSTEKKKDPWVIHGENLVAEVSVTAHSQLVDILRNDGLSVSSEQVTSEQMVRVHISGPEELIQHSVNTFVELNPQAPLDVLQTGAADEA